MNLVDVGYARNGYGIFLEIERIDDRAFHSLGGGGRIFDDEARFNLDLWLIGITVQVFYRPLVADLRALGSKIAAAAKSAARWLVAPHVR